MLEIKPKKEVGLISFYLKHRKEKEEGTSLKVLHKRCLRLNLSKECQTNSSYQDPLAIKLINYEDVDALLSQIIGKYLPGLMNS